MWGVCQLVQLPSLQGLECFPFSSGLGPALFQEWNLSFLLSDSEKVTCPGDLKP